MNDQPDGHPNESLDLYALGALDGDEARAVEDHAATCGACSRRLGEAERTVAALAALTVPTFEVPAALGERIAASARTSAIARTRTRPNVARFGALAACVAAGAIGIAGVRDITVQRAAIASDDRAFAAIAASHFTHQTLAKRDPAAPTAKVLWGKDPLWLYVIVDAPACACTVVERTASGERDLGAPQARGATATLFVPDAPEATGVELRSGARVLATAQKP